MPGKKRSAGKRKAHNPMPAQSRKKITLTQRQQQALELRIAGNNFDQIAATMGYRNRSGAYKAVEEALRRTLQEPADTYRQMELERLDKMLLSIWERAVTPGEEQWDAFDRVLKIQSQRTYYITGLKVPDRIAPTTPDGEQPYNPQTAAAEFAVLMAQLGQRYAGTEPQTIPGATPGTTPAE